MAAASPPEGWLSVGHLRRPHGLRGEIFVQLTTDRVERAEPGSRFWAQGGDLTMRSSRRSGAGRLIAAFDEIADRTAAERMVNVELFAEPLDDPDAMWAHDVIGTRVVDQHGVERGEVVSLVENPAADLLELDDGSLVPSNFVVVVDLDRGVTDVDVPDGLFE
ncbi:MAG: ribosome maturation factor RimM [Actinomycetota bacterium]